MQYGDSDGNAYNYTASDLESPDEEEESDRGASDHLGSDTMAEVRQKPTPDTQLMEWLTLPGQVVAYAYHGHGIGSEAEIKVRCYCHCY